MNLNCDHSVSPDGWTFRFMTDPKRALEAAQLYKESGFEVKTEKPSPKDFGPDCSDCGKTACQDYLRVYTRKAADK